MGGVFGQSIYARGGIVAGLRLLQFSPHHALALMEIDSPYINGGAVSTYDTTAALIICTGSRKDGLDRLYRFAGSKTIRAIWWLWWVFRSHSKISEDLHEHITSSVKSPEIWIETECKGKPTGAPWPYYIVSVIAQEMPSIPYADIWDMPLTELACHKAIIDERSGGAEIAEQDLMRLRGSKESD